MDAHVNLTGMAAVGLAALLCGMVMTRLRQPALVGYILAGVLLGPSAFGVVADRDQIAGLAELGILLLLFLIGTELSVRAFMVTWRLALGAVALQLGTSLAAIFLCATFLGFTVAESVLLGFVIALSSTAVAIKMLEEIGESRSRVGRITVAILIGQDLAFLPMLLIVGTLGDKGGIGLVAILQIVLAVGVLVALVRFLNRNRVNLPFAEVVIGHVDLSPLTGLVYCFGFGALFGLVGLSPAYGAFLAGLVIGRSRQREQVITSVRPIQSILVMVFFLSIGLLIDLRFIVENIGAVLVLLFVVTLFKTAVNVGIMRLLGESWQNASLQGLTLSQIGEFSFLLAASGLAAGAISAEQSRLVIAVTVLSIAVSPLWLLSARRVHGIASRRINTLQELIDAAYGDDVTAARRRSRRFMIVMRLIARHGWRRLVEIIPVLARLHPPHRPAQPTALLAPPAAKAATASMNESASGADAGMPAAAAGAQPASPASAETAPAATGPEAGSAPEPEAGSEPGPEAEPESAPEPGPQPHPAPGSRAEAEPADGTPPPEATLARLRSLVLAAAGRPRRDADSKAGAGTDPEEAKRAADDPADDPRAPKDA